MNISIGQNCLNKKNPFEYIVPPPHKWGPNNNSFSYRYAAINETASLIQRNIISAVAESEKRSIHARKQTSYPFLIQMGPPKINAYFFLWFYTILCGCQRLSGTIGFEFEPFPCRGVQLMSLCYCGAYMDNTNIVQVISVPKFQGIWNVETFIRVSTQRQQITDVM